MKGFRDFILRGNVIDLAVAVAIGTAFTALVAAFNKAVITPLVSLFLGNGADGFTYEVTVGDRTATFELDLIINAVLTFLITAAVIYFLIVLPYQKMRDRLSPPKPTEETVPTDEQQVALLAEIRDLLGRRPS